MKTEHSPLPWRWTPTKNSFDLGGFQDINGKWICDFGDSEQYYPICGEEPKDADIALIVKAVNSHQLLVDACKAALVYDGSIAGRARRGEFDLMADGNGVAEGIDLDVLYDDWISKSHAALKAVEEA